jgi:hypothetical protein
MKPPVSAGPVAAATKCVTFSVAISVANSGRDGVNVTMLPAGEIASVPGTGPLQRPETLMFCGVIVAGLTTALKVSVTTAAGDTPRAALAGVTLVTVSWAVATVASNGRKNAGRKRCMGIPGTEVRTW